MASYNVTVKGLVETTFHVKDAANPEEAIAQVQAGEWEDATDDTIKILSFNATVEEEHA